MSTASCASSPKLGLGRSGPASSLASCAPAQQVHQQGRPIRFVKASADGTPRMFSHCTGSPQGAGSPLPRLLGARSGSQNYIASKTLQSQQQPQQSQQVQPSILSSAQKQQQQVQPQRCQRQQQLQQQQALQRQQQVVQQQQQRQHQQQQQQAQQQRVCGVQQRNPPANLHQQRQQLTRPHLQLQQQPKQQQQQRPSQPQHEEKLPKYQQQQQQQRQVSTPIVANASPSSSGAHLEVTPATMQIDQSNPVIALLAECSLDQYGKVLLLSGFDTLEVMLEMEDSDVRDLGIARGHWLKLRRHLRESVLVTNKGEAKQLSSDRTEPSNHGLGDRVPLPPNAPIFYGSDKIKDDVQKSWDRIQEIGILYAGEILYKKVFELAPEARALMPPEVTAKYRISSFSEEELDPDFVENKTLSNMFGKIFNVVGCSVTGLHDLNRLVPKLHSLGARHIGYNAPEEAWEVVGKAVNFTLHKLLGETLTPDVEHVWKLCLALVSSVMIQGMREAKAARGIAAQ